ncbi:hypothetical protein QTP88_022449 [Uroleucon formosanum]
MSYTLKNFFSVIIVVRIVLDVPSSFIIFVNILYYRGLHHERILILNIGILLNFQKCIDSTQQHNVIAYPIAITHRRIYSIIIHIYTIYRRSIVRSNRVCSGNNVYAGSMINSEIINQLRDECLRRLKYKLNYNMRVASCRGSRDFACERQASILQAASKLYNTYIYSVQIQMTDEAE